MLTINNTFDTWSNICMREEIDGSAGIIIISDEECEDCVKIAINPYIEFSAETIAEIEDNVFGCTITVLNRGELDHLENRLSFIPTPTPKEKIGTYFQWAKNKEFRGFPLYEDTILKKDMVYTLFKEGKTSIICPPELEGTKILCAYLIAGAVPSNLAQPHLVKQLREAFKNFSDEKIEGIMREYDIQNPKRKNLFRERNLMFLSRAVKKENILSDLI